METETIGSRIRAARKELGYSQEELAALLYMKKTTICKYEKDLHDIPSSVIIQLARILHTSPNYILLGEVKEEGWMEEMYELMENIKSPEMRRLALKQLRCVAEV
jgi:transcriptional regulator with XRE-family HTH domain